MVNDHRTELKVSDVHKVMDGDLDPFIEAFLNASGIKRRDHRVRRSGAAREAERAAGARRRAVCVPIRAYRDRATGDRRVQERRRSGAVRARGRLVALRPHGKTTFAHLEDQSGKIQLYFKGDELGAELYEVLELLDLGDHVGVAGRLMKTRTGEITLARRGIHAPLQGPAPAAARQGGRERGETRRAVGSELRSRQRYADLAVHPEVREVFRLRTRIVQGIRAFLDAKGYLRWRRRSCSRCTAAPRRGPSRPLRSPDATFYLRIADELYLKRCLVGGLEKVYEIGHDFRNEGLSRFHNPEFTMAEWYQAYADYNDMAC